MGAIARLAPLLVVVGLAACTQEWRVLTRATHPHTGAFESLSFVDERHGWATLAGHAFRTEDGGRHWSEGPCEGLATICQFALFSTVSNGRLFGSRKTEGELSAAVLATQDGGSTWTESLVGVATTLLSATECSDGDIFAVGAGAIIRSTDRGSSWTVVYWDSTDTSFWSVDCSTTEDVWVSGSSGTLLRSSDRGENWLRKDVGTTLGLSSVVIDGDTGIIVGKNGLILHSVDSGNSWNLVPSRTTAWLMDAALLKNGAGIAVGEGGTILRTSDGGRTWRQAASPVAEDLVAIASVDDRIWIGGGVGLILQSGD